MQRKLFTLLFASVLAFPSATAVFAQTAPAQAKEARIEGRIIRSSKEHSTLTVQKADSTNQSTVQYDSSTKWVSQYHGEQKVSDIDPGEVKDGDFVICKGTWENNIFHATLISKRLSHPA